MSSRTPDTLARIGPDEPTHTVLKVDPMNSIAMTNLNIWKWGLLGIAAVFASGCQTHEREFHMGCTDLDYPDTYNEEADTDDGSCCRRVDKQAVLWQRLVADPNSGISVQLDFVRLASKLQGPCLIRFDPDSNYTPYSYAFYGCYQLVVDHTNGLANGVSLKEVRQELDTMIIGRLGCADPISGVAPGVNTLDLYLTLHFTRGLDTTTIPELNLTLDALGQNLPAIGVEYDSDINVGIDEAWFDLDSLRLN